jgi:hypothetical protein
MIGNGVLTVPKDRQGVTVRLSGGEVLEGEIFLEFMSELLSTHQKLTAFLENDTLFFPVKLAKTDTTEFVNKKNVWSVEVAVPGDRESGYFPQLFMHSITVTVHFCDGATISGDLLAEAPREKARLSDCLNMANQFLSVKTGAKICYLNKDALRTVMHADNA